MLFEAIRHEMQHSMDYKLSLFDLQTSSYQALQRVLVSLGDRSGLLTYCVVSLWQMTTSLCMLAVLIFTPYTLVSANKAQMIT